MLHRVLPLATLLSAALIGCDATGGSTDSIIPAKPTFTVASRSPGAGREGVPVTAQISITFNTDIDPASVQTGVITVNGRAYGDLAVTGNSLLFTPTGGLDSGTAYSIALSSDITGLNGIPLGPYAQWGFKTAGTLTTHDNMLLVRPRR